MGSFILPRENRALLQFTLDIVSSVRGTPSAALHSATNSLPQTTLVPTTGIFAMPTAPARKVEQRMASEN